MKNCSQCEYKDECKNRKTTFHVGDSVRFINNKNHREYWKEFNTISYGDIGVVQSVYKDNDWGFECKGEPYYVVRMNPYGNWRICSCNLEHI